MRRSLHVQQDGDPVGPVEVPLLSIVVLAQPPIGTTGREP
jgi:hypothetical protein